MASSDIIKVIERLGQLKEKFRRVARRQEITVYKQEGTDKVRAISWERNQYPKQSGFYCLRSNKLDLKEQELFNIFTMLTDVEDAFRSMNLG